MRLERPPNQVLVVFGASGDLTRRKIQLKIAGGDGPPKRAVLLED